MTAAGTFALDTNTYAPSSGIALSALAAQAQDTVVMNVAASAAPTAVAMPTCTTGADLYNTTTHTWSCVSTSGAPANVVLSYKTSATMPVYTTQQSLASVTGVSGGSGFSGSGTIFLTNFNNGCSAGNTATVTLSAGSFSSATVTGIGNGCTAAPTSATCTSGTASCTGSPISITVATTVSLQSNQIASITIPAGIMGLNSVAHVTLTGSACGGSTTPYASCSVVNTGTCILKTYMYSAATGTGTSNIFFTYGAAAAAKPISQFNVITNLNSLSVPSSNRDRIQWHLARSRQPRIRNFG